jgi:hypothetical protein
MTKTIYKSEKFIISKFMVICTYDNFKIEIKKLSLCDEEVKSGS